MLLSLKISDVAAAASENSSNDLNENTRVDKSGWEPDCEAVCENDDEPDAAGVVLLSLIHI